MIDSGFLGPGSREIKLTAKEQEKPFWMRAVFCILLVTMIVNIC